MQGKRCSMPVPPCIKNMREANSSYHFRAYEGFDIIQLWLVIVRNHYSQMLKRIIIFLRHVCQNTMYGWDSQYRQNHNYLFLEKINLKETLIYREIIKLKAWINAKIIKTGFNQVLDMFTKFKCLNRHHLVILFIHSSGVILLRRWPKKIWPE